jgi:hypothetical protein
LYKVIKPNGLHNFGVRKLLKIKGTVTARLKAKIEEGFFATLRMTGRNRIGMKAARI